MQTSVGYTLAPESHQASVTWEPDLFWNFSPQSQAELYAFVNRPSDPDKGFSVPKIIATYRRAIPREMWIALSLNGLDLDRWSLEGYRIRPLLAAEWMPDLGKHWAVYFRAGPYYELSRYTQAPDGTDFARWGLNEKAAIAYLVGPIYLELDLVVDQRYARSWKNDYSTYEKVGYRFNPSVMAGVTHLLLSSAIDTTTGYSVPLRLWDGRASRISGFVEWDISL